MSASSNADSTVRVAGGLLLRIAERDAQALAHLVEKHDGEIVRLCFLISGDIDLARDAAQNTWLKLWSRPPALRDESRLRSWLLSVAANDMRQTMRRRRLGAIREIEAVGPDPQVTPLRPDSGIDLDRVLRRLDPDERELLGLRYALGMSSAEIGQHLGLTAEGARTRLHRLLEKIRRELDDG